jgi:hypothetical protein
MGWPDGKHFPGVAALGCGNFLGFLENIWAIWQKISRKNLILNKFCAKVAEGFG